MRDIVLETDRVIMKSPVNIINANDVVEAISDRETLQYLCPAPYDYSEDTANSFLNYLKTAEESESKLELGLFYKPNDLFIGMMSLENINYENSSCEIGYWLSKKFTGKGMACEPAKKIIEFAFESLKMNVISAYVVKEHVKSISLLERLGFIQKELLLNNVENKGVMVDRYWYFLKKGGI